MTANVDCVIGQKPHPRHCLTGGKPTNDKWCDGTPEPDELWEDESGPPGASTPAGPDQHKTLREGASRG